MDTFTKIMFARNELENRISELQKILELSENDMMIVTEMLLSTARYKSVIRNVYNNLKPIEKKTDDETMEELKKREVSNNGNTNEKGQ